MPKKKLKYSLTIKLVDNTTGKDADVYMESNDSKKLADGAGKFIEAACNLVNLKPTELIEVQNSIQELIKNKI